MMGKFDWENYLKLAKTLAQVNQPENIRCAISKSYYALFNILCQKIGLKDSFDKHKALIDMLSDLDISVTTALEWIEDDDIKWIAGELRKLRRLRNQADYDASSSLSQTTAQEVCLKAQEMLNMIKQAD